MNNELQTVGKNKVITLKYVLFDDDSGKVLEYRDDMRFLHGGAEEDLPKLHEAVEGYAVGMSCDITLTEDDAFGAYNPDLLIKDQIDNFPPGEVEIGSTIEGHTEAGEILLFRVTDIDGDVVTVDGNHPLAGVNLRFTVEVQEIREASSLEIERGRAFKITSTKPKETDSYH